MIIKVVLTIIFLAVMIGVGLYTRKQASSVDGFVLGGRAVGPWLTAFAFGTSYFSAVVFVGYAGQFGWKYGLSSTWIGVGNAVIGSLLAWLILGKRTKLMTQHIESRTMPDFFGTRFADQGLRIAASIIAFVFLIPYTAGVYKGISTLFEMGFGIPYEYCVVIMAILTAVYVILGGYKATAMNDFIQGIIMLFGIVAVIVAVIAAQGGLSEAVSKLGALPADGATEAGSGMFATWFGPDPWGLLGVVVLTSLGTMGLPQMVGKFYSITDEAAIKRGTVISTIFAFIVAGGCYFLGGFGRLYDPVIAANGKIAFDSIVPAMLVTLPDVLIALVVLLVLSASMSTLSSLVLTSSSTLTLDVLKKTVMKDMDDKKQLLIMRLFVAFFIVLSVVLALNPPTFIAQMMGISWGALAGAFLAPFLYGLYSRNITEASVWASFIVGVGLTVSNMFLKFIKSPINAGAIAMIAGLIVVPIVSLVTKKPDKRFVDEIFTCFEQTVTVKRKTALEEDSYTRAIK